MEFYDNLTDNGVFFFWVVLFLIIILLVLSVFLLLKNKKLTELIEKGENEEDEFIPIQNETMIKNGANVAFNEDERNTNVKELDKDIEHIEIMGEVTNPKVDGSTESKLELKEDVSDTKIDMTNGKTNIEISTPGVYQKNVLREISRKMPTSPIHIDKSNIDEDTSIYTVSNDENDYDLDEIYLREESVSPLEEMEDSYDVNDNMKFASEIVSRMEEEMKPSNIELTDYEKKQEEEAIISYDELQKVKDKIYNITEDEETEDFIDELKIFRSDLE